MVMATELPSSGNSDQNQHKSDAMADTNKGSPKASTPNERQNSRALRSKSSRQNSNFISKSDLEELNRHGKDKEQSSKQLDPDESHGNNKSDTHSQVAQLRQLLLLHLELIQQQQEKLQKRDRELNQLKIEKEQVLKPGGILLLRDYGLYDHAMLRFAPGHKISENFYVRQDGTRAYYFSTEYIETLTREAGYSILENKYVERRTVNKKENIDVPRIFIQGKFLKPDLK
ncbi:Methyltransferase-like protein 6 [Exaiptasia diaphana]|nr:Methyltransferase-like protein 6 [Exaiptasia diaphana]